MKEEQKKNSRTKAAEEKKPPAGWKLTEEDKAFLRSCGIRPN